LPREGQRGGRVKRWDIGSGRLGVTLGLFVTVVMIATGCGDGDDTSVSSLDANVAASEAAAVPPETFSRLVAQSSSVETHPGPGALFVVSVDDRTRLTVSPNLSDGLTIRHPSMTFGIRPLGADVPGSVPANGIAIYRQVSPATDVMIQALGSAVGRVIYLIGGPTAPAAFDTALDLPAGVSLEKREDGVIARSEGGTEVFGVPAPWAFDAKGDPIPSRYVVSGNVITLQVDHRAEGVDYPVVADPAILAPLGGLALRWVAGQVVQRSVTWAGQQLAGDPCFTAMLSDALIPGKASCTATAPSSPAGQSPGNLQVVTDGSTQAQTGHPQAGNYNPQAPPQPALAPAPAPQPAPAPAPAPQPAPAPAPQPAPASAPQPAPAPPPPAPRISLSRGRPAPQGSWYSVSLSGFSPRSQVTVTCRDSVDPGGFWSQTFTMDGAGNAGDSTLCYSADGPDHWVTGSGVKSNHVSWGGGSPTPPPPPPPPAPRISLSRGGPAPQGSWYSVSLSGFSPRSQVTVTCRDSVDPGGFWSQTFTMDGAGNAGDSTLCYSADGPDHWVTGSGVESNHVSW
jgi:hypothetical protein